MLRTERIPVISLFLALIVPALAGCVQDSPPAGDAPPTSDGGNGGTPPPPGSVTKEDAFANFQDAMSSLDSPTDGPKRFAATVQAEAANSTENWEMRFLVDANEGRMIVHMKGKAPEGPGAMMGDEFIGGQIWKTSFFGSAAFLIGTYNESAEPPTNLGDYQGAPGTDGGSFASPEEFFGMVKQAAKDDLKSERVITHQGKPALELIFERTEGSATIKATIIVWTDPLRPARFDVTMRDPDAEDDVQRDGRLVVDFSYDADATHPWEPALVRAETMTLLTANDTQSAFGGFGSFGGDSESSAKTFTVQPSKQPGLVPLAEVEARVFESGEQPGQGAAVLTLPLEQGTAENEDVRVTFQDKDGDGRVSPGDVLTLEPKGANSEDESGFGSGYTVGFYDETTKVFLAPGAGLLGALVALAVVAVGLRRRG